LSDALPPSATSDPAENYTSTSERRYAPATPCQIPAPDVGELIRHLIALAKPAYAPRL
jgi:hypothetical protein